MIDRSDRDCTYRAGPSRFRRVDVDVQWFERALPRVIDGKGVHVTSAATTASVVVVVAAAATAAAAAVVIMVTSVDAAVAAISLLIATAVVAAAVCVQISSWQFV
jgi:hypothetical protein